MPTLNAEFDRLYRSHTRQLTAFARRRVGALEAEDIVHDAYIRALHEESVTRVPCQSAFLFRIVANLTVDTARKALVRSRYANERLMNSQPAQEPAASIEDRVELRQLCVQLDELPPVCREAFLLYFIEDLDHAETAQRLGVTVRTVARHLTRARRHLRRRGAP